MSKRARKQAYAFAEAQIRKGCQVFVVAPLIEASETRSMSEIQAAQELFHELQALLPEVRIRLLHGRMDAVEKETVMQAFRNHRIDLLVSTTVVEVGVDVPGATVMIVENAERFGLAQDAAVIVLEEGVFQVFQRFQGPLFGYREYRATLG